MYNVLYHFKLTKKKTQNPQPQATFNTIFLLHGLIDCCTQKAEHEFEYDFINLQHYSVTCMMMSVESWPLLFFTHVPASQPASQPCLLFMLWVGFGVGVLDKSERQTRALVWAAEGGEKASIMSAAISPTGKNSSTSGGGGRGGSISGRTTIDAASAASAITPTAPRHLIITIIISLSLSLLSPYPTTLSLSLSLSL